MTRPKFGRRSFLRGTAAAGAGWLILRSPRSAFGYAANEKLNIALVGVGGRGSWFVDTVPKAQNVVALCDVNEERAAASFAKLPDVPRHHDFREMLDRRGREIDAVIIAAPDAIHAPACLRAMALGKHVFCEKPLTHTVREARRMREAAARAKVATQLGNQGTSSEAFRRSVELIRASLLGEIREVHAWNEGGGSGRSAAPSGEQPVPAGLQWDLWLGPSRSRPYTREWMNWHAWREFATGQLGNWASHTMNLAFKSLRLDELWDAGAGRDAAARTFRVRAECEAPNRVAFPRWEMIAYEFPARGALPPVTVRWYNGGRIPRGRDDLERILGRRLDWGDAGEKKYKDHAGCLVVGSKGVLHSTGHNMSFSLLSEELTAAAKGVPETLPRARGGHEPEWYAACRGGPAPMSSFEYGSRLAEFTHLGNVATLHPGETLAYEPVEGVLTGPPGAAAALDKEYRPGWMP